ncbi:MAG: hypothetical protein ACLFSQ_10635 [Candidatus Zixiibacteriota bacterium]
MDILKNSTNVSLRIIDYYRNWGPVYEGLRIVLNSRGINFTPQYLSGISGEAMSFYRTGFDNEYRNTAEELIDFIKSLGFKPERLNPSNEPDDIQKAIDAIIEEIDNGRALLLWNAFTLCEWDVICGYNKKTREFLGRGSMVGKDDFATEDWTRAFKSTISCKSKGAIFIKQNKISYDPNQLELQAMKNGIAHCKNEDDLPEDMGGYKGFIKWAENFGDPERLPSRKDQYNMAVYASLHSTAYMFLKEIMGKYPKAQDNISRAAFLFREEASYLQQVFKLVFNNWQLPKRINPDTNEAASELLYNAAENYKNAFSELQKVVDILED